MRASICCIAPAGAMRFLSAQLASRRRALAAGKWTYSRLQKVNWQNLVLLAFADRAYDEHAFEGLKEREPAPRRFWNCIPEAERAEIVETALERPELTPCELAWHVTDTRGTFVPKSSVFRILKAFDMVTSPGFIVMSARDKFPQPTRRVYELWQTDFTYFKVVSWGWYYLLTVLDDYSRYIVSRKLTTGMESSDVTTLLDQAIEVTGVTGVPVRHRPRLLSENGPYFISKELGESLASQEMTHARRKPYHPMTQGKIERYHRTMKNVVKLQNYDLPWELEREVEGFVRHYGHERVHESLGNLTPEDVYLGRGREIRTARARVKEQTLRRRRRINQGLPTRVEERILTSLYRVGVP